MTTAQALAEATKAYVISPAGYGKTHIIAQAVALTPAQRQLVLTHTHAGIDSLRRKMNFLKVPASSYHIETIAGFALRYVSAYPKTSKINNLKPSTGIEWNQIYEGFSRLLINKHIQSVLKISYQGIYVDEYQDCTCQQHELILTLSELLPCRLLGDPLQGIFEFRNNPIINWDRDIKPHFTALTALDYPWRWNKGDRALGSWLSSVRASLDTKSPINLNNLPLSVKWVQLSTDPRQHEVIQRVVCKSALRNNGNTIVIYPHLEREPQCIKFVQGLTQPYQMVETIDCKSLMSTARNLFETTGFERALTVIDFLGKCFSPLSSIPALNTLKINFKKSKLGKPTSNVELASSVQAVVTSNCFSKVTQVLEAFYKLPELKCYRRELYWAMHKTLQIFEAGGQETLEDVAWDVRNRTRQIGRTIPKFAVGRTLLIKGLEFDHAIILDADALDSKNLYVAITRGSRSLTILSRSKVLVPR